MSQAREAAISDSPSGKFSRSRKRPLISWAYLLHSTLVLEKGETHHALEYSKNSLKVLFQDWCKLEKALPERSSLPKPGLKPNSNSCFSSSLIKENELSIQCSTGPDFWSLAYPMIRCLSRTTSIYAHLGMFQETIYYAERAHTVAKMTDSRLYITQTGVLLSSIYSRGGQLDRARHLVTEARRVFGKDYRTFSSISLACQISEVYRELKDDEAEVEMMALADGAINFVMNSNLVNDTKSDESTLASKMSQLSIKDAPKPGRARGHARTTSSAAIMARGHSRKASVRKPKAASSSTRDPDPAEDVQLSFLRGALLVQQALGIMEKEEWSKAFSVLQQAGKLVKLPTRLAQERMAMASCLIGESMDMMMRDPVFSVIPESALCFPAVHETCNLASSKDRCLLAASPQRQSRKTGATQERTRSALMDKLFQAQEYLMEIHTTIMDTGDRSMVKTVMKTLQNLAIMLSAACSPRQSQRCQPPFATFPIDLGRTLLWQREQQVLILERAPPAEETCWPQPLQKSGEPGLKTRALDLNNLRQLRTDYADILPKQWNVISITIDEPTNQLTLVNFVSSVEPMVIKAPIMRDGEEEFTFAEGRDELVDLIARINKSCRVTDVDTSTKAGKSKWWALRSSLEAELQGLLGKVEQYWLGGFKGIFSQHKYRPQLLAKFRQDLQGILDRHLPSRQKRPGKNKVRSRGGSRPETRSGTTMNTASRKKDSDDKNNNNNNAATATGSSSLSLDVFDDRVLELFVGLGDISAGPDLDIMDELGDLLNFVTDILGWYGEQNARDEIDWDSMILDTHDALKTYHAAAAAAAAAATRGSGWREHGRHNFVLVLVPLKGEKILSHGTGFNFWYIFSSGVSFKISDQPPPPLLGLV